MKIFKIIDDSLKDNATGQYSHARIIAMVVAFAATVFMWKLIITSGMTIDYFLAYLSYGVGSSGLNKLLDIKDDARTMQAKSAITAPSDDPKPPKE